jgi:hypothetical protein
MHNGQLIIARSENVLKDKSYALAILIVQTVRQLQNNKEFGLSSKANRQKA